MVLSVKFKRIIAAIFIAVCIAIGLGVGLGVGLTRNRGGSSDNTITNTSTPKNSSTTSIPKPRKLWVPKVNTTWDYKLDNPLNSVTAGVQVFDIDLFDNPQSIIDEIHLQNKSVICYFSAGSYENWRSDSKKFNGSDLGKSLSGWEGERWVNLSSPNVRNIMASRIKLAHEKSCDAIDPDNINGYENDNGLGLTQSDSVEFIKFLSKEAHSYNISLSLKNSAEIIEKVIQLVDFSVQEQCVEYGECQPYEKFIAANKAVLHVEYPKGGKSNQQNVNSTTLDHYCRSRYESGFSTIIKNLNLDSWIQRC
ncbi:glycoside hydrolase superfamily [Scheffersomyces xylosifermentans]|uniref:glycoside hydrolase superfamily n=1 Tax=Scheffersomyces xylosifermentans TaxID=1304137 RepID=UPI00315D7CCA